MQKPPRPSQAHAAPHWAVQVEGELAFQNNIVAHEAAAARGRRMQCYAGLPHTGMYHAYPNTNTAFETTAAEGIRINASAGM